MAVELSEDRSRVINITEGTPVLVPYTDDIVEKYNGDVENLGNPVAKSVKDGMSILIFYNNRETVVIVAFMDSFFYYKIGSVLNFAKGEVKTFFSSLPSAEIDTVLEAFNNGFKENNLFTFFKFIIGGWYFIDSAECGLHVMRIQDAFIELIMRVLERKTHYRLN